MKRRTFFQTILGLRVIPSSAAEEQKESLHLMKDGDVLSAGMMNRIINKLNKVEADLRKK